MKIHFIALLSILLSGCANPLFDVGKTETVLPLSKAWFESQIVEYITTDISDANMARMMGANYVPRLRDALEANRVDHWSSVFTGLRITNR